MNSPVTVDVNKQDTGEGMGPRQGHQRGLPGGSDCELSLGRRKE